MKEGEDPIWLLPLPLLLYQSHNPLPETLAMTEKDKVRHKQNQSPVVSPFFFCLFCVFMPSLTSLQIHNACVRKCRRALVLGQCQTMTEKGKEMAGTSPSDRCFGTTFLSLSCFPLVFLFFCLSSISLNHRHSSLPLSVSTTQHTPRLRGSPYHTIPHPLPYLT